MIPIMKQEIISCLEEVKEHQAKPVCDCNDCAMLGRKLLIIQHCINIMNEKPEDYTII